MAYSTSDYYITTARDIPAHQYPNVYTVVETVLPAGVTVAAGGYPLHVITGRYRDETVVVLEPVALRGRQYTVRSRDLLDARA